MNKAVLIAACALLGGCARAAAVETAAPAAPDWRRVATPADRARLREWRTAFVAGLSQARAAGHGAEIAREGVLLDPDAGRSAKPAAGDYRCRVIKLGVKGSGGVPYVAYPPFMCRIDEEAGVASFSKLTGSQRPVGVIFGDAQRTVFLGTLMLGDEKRALDYGRDRERDMVGAVEALPGGRWRLILPYPHYESLIDVIELVPAGPARS
ncbi:DUF4893 domain-containing protein [Sphingomonas sp. ID1715]|uniref:DUF4893 domain-containing protein n=1 Tax=Sphingomonas sp. ID1715 TaxID=1656898 RepID=UPI001488A2DC|nr:DUF4893 domain-containing protein [Sphingomonas sp. ID1715]NNM76208.1 DUF4893 domain-containing protein [Sphingomonas sp. ID1715]